ncbi:hypothetical protein AX15_001318 [Amanita polypyramis BW_CC]|nr:hypothetical protein AX15_001318 [Amanita polypyramis BW_CC]
MNFTRLLATTNRRSSSLLIGSCERRWLYAQYYSSQPQGGASGDPDPAESTTVSNPNSIFSDGSAWDRVFANLDDHKARSRPSQRDLRSAKVAQRKPGRRQTMTAREISAFDDVFNMIFDAASKQEHAKAASRGGSSEMSAIGDMFTTLRLSPRGLRWASEQDELLDRRKEEIDLCASDVELLHWAQREVLDVFDNLHSSSQRQHSGQATTTEQDKDESEDDNSTPTSVPPPSPSSSPSALHIQAYSPLVAYLMRTFRDKYRDPYLALALFDKVRRRSLVSYVFGCSTQVYNELIETKWMWFRDLKGVHDAVEEMVVNGVAVDTRTRNLIEIVRREVGERNEWAENVDPRGGEVWNLLLRLDHFIAKSTTRKKKTANWDEWKKETLTDRHEDKWGFDKWSMT